MKNKILAVLASVGLVASASAVDVNENLKIQGFLDFSYDHTEYTDSGTLANTNSDSQSLELDEVEIDFLFNVGDVTGEVHIDDHGTEDGNNNFDVEQAHFTYSLDSGVSFTFGKYGSSLGFEREDPAGLYTYSRAYGDIDNNGVDNLSGNAVDDADNNARSQSFNLGNVDANVVHGLTVGYAGDTFSIAASIENPAGGEQDNLETNNADLELSFSYTGIENVVIGGGYFFDNEALNADEEDVLNIYASTSFGKLFLAAEYIEIQTENTAFGDLDGYMILADYDFNDKLGAAFRISSNETNTANVDYDMITIAPNYSITDSLGVIIEYNDIDQGTIDQNQLAVELTYTF
jgi:hypothetical protein